MNEAGQGEGLAWPFLIGAILRYLAGWPASAQVL